MGAKYFALATIEGLHLTCDFVIHSAALFGCPPRYLPTPVGIHDLYREPYEIYGSIPFRDYAQFAGVAFMDELTLNTLQSVAIASLRQFTCIAWELDHDAVGAFSTDTETSSSVLFRTVNGGERILDIIRLFLFTPGEDASIGRLGSLGGGITGIWICSAEDERAQFIARRTSRMQLVQDPVERDLGEVRKIYNHDVFRELCSVVCSGADDDPTLTLVLRSLRILRESRDIQSLEARFLRLAAAAEHLARRQEGKRLQGDALRSSITKLASKGWRTDDDVLETVKELWNQARNPLSHSTESFPSIGRDAKWGGPLS